MWLIEKIIIAWSLIRNEGLKSFSKAFLAFIKRGLRNLNTEDETELYNQIIKRKKIKISNKRQITADLANFPNKPLLSYITFIKGKINPTSLILPESLEEQYYKNYELNIFYTQETYSLNKFLIKETSKKTNINFIKIQNFSFNEIIEQTYKHCNGQYIAFVSIEDSLEQDTNYEIIRTLNLKGKIPEVIYTDEDQIDDTGRFSNPHFKPDYSPDLLRSYNYINNLLFFHKSMLPKIMDNPGTNVSSAWYYYFTLHLCNNAGSIKHIPKALYHNSLKNNKVSDISYNSYSNEDGRIALQQFFKDIKIEANTKFSGIKGCYHNFYISQKTELISIIIPFKDKSQYLKKCLNSIKKHTRYPNYEIILVSNNSVEKETLTYMDQLAKVKEAKIYKYDEAFNYSAINNWAVERANGKYILFLNNDIEILTDNWLGIMHGHFCNPKTASVGCKLIYPDYRIQHGGVIIGIAGVADHAFKFFPHDAPGYFYRSSVCGNYSACTAACLISPKKLFIEAGGFNEKDLAIAYNDVDYELKLLEKGYYNVYDPNVICIHYESISRGEDLSQEQLKRVYSEINYIKKSWGTDKIPDPFYNPNLTLNKKDFSLRIN